MEEAAEVPRPRLLGPLGDNRRLHTPLQAASEAPPAARRPPGLVAPGVSKPLLIFLQAWVGEPLFVAERQSLEVAEVAVGCQPWLCEVSVQKNREVLPFCRCSRYLLLLFFVLMDSCSYVVYTPLVAVYCCCAISSLAHRLPDNSIHALGHCCWVL